MTIGHKRVRAIPTKQTTTIQSARWITAQLYVPLAAPTTEARLVAVCGREAEDGRILSDVTLSLCAAYLGSACEHLMNSVDIQPSEWLMGAARNGALMNPCNFLR